jgi:hypothetical protein
LRKKAAAAINIKKGGTTNNMDLIKIRIDVKNAEHMFKKALGALERNPYLLVKIVNSVSGRIEVCEGGDGF